MSQQMPGETNYSNNNRLSCFKTVRTMFENEHFRIYIILYTFDSHAIITLALYKL